MSAADASIRESDAAEHLHLLRALARELERAMSAIVANDLAELEDSIAQQQALSVRLSGVAGEPASAAPLRRTAAGAGMEAGLGEQIRAAAISLDSLNRRYAALLEHASSSVAMMVSLFRSFQGEIREGAGPRLHQATWSCRV